MQSLTQSKTDSKAQAIIEPIDFSFRDLMHFEEINESHPRYKDKTSEPKMIDGKYASLGLKLGYNALRDVEGLYEWCTLSFAYVNQINTIDLSFNCLSNIPKDLAKFDGLKCLYLHGNRLFDLAELDTIKNLKNLTSLTLHGNPIENLPSFRHYVLTKIPNLKHLNFSGISKADRQTASVWIKSNKPQLKATLETDKVKDKKKKEADDE